MQKRRLGKTDLWVSPIGLGTVKLGRDVGVKYPHAFNLPSDEVITRLLSIAMDSGINLLDTAPAYGSSEARLGKLLKGKRQDWVIVTKAGEEFIEGKSYFDFSPAHLVKSIERSLLRLQTDYIDMVLVHSDGNDKEIIEVFEVFQTLNKLKDAGKIRSFGMSTKTLAGGLLTIDQADAAMVTYHPGYTDEQAVLTYANQQQKGILIKKALASGHQPLVTEALQFIFQEPGVTSVIIGTINPLHLQQNIESAEKVACRLG